MAAIDVKFTELQEELEREYFRELHTVATRVFDAAPDILTPYIESLQDASPSERLLALHEAPVNVLSVITGVTVTEEILERYSRVRELDRIERSKRTQFLATRQGLQQALTELGYMKLGARKGFEMWQLADPDSESIRKPTRVTVAPPTYITPDGREFYDISYVAELLRFVRNQDEHSTVFQTTFPKSLF